MEPAHLAHQLMRAVLLALRWCVYGLLWACRPVLVPILFWLAVGGVALWVIFVWVAGDSAFPTGRVLGMSLGCGLGAVTYYALLEWLRPAPSR